MANIAVIVAIGEYAENIVPKIRYAHEDAWGLSRVLSRIGYDLAAQQLVIGEQATRSSILSGIRSAAQVASPRDTLLLFYVGHGFAAEHHSYLTCFDTEGPADTRSSILLDDILSELRMSQCDQGILLLDAACRDKSTGSEIDSDADTTLEEAVDDFVQADRRFACFTASRSGQSSWPADQFQHSAWAYNLIRVLAGDEPSVLDSRGRLSAVALEKYLKSAVQRTLRLSYSDRKEQTPWSSFSNRRMQLADLNEVLAERQPASQAQVAGPQRITLLRSEVEKVRKLAGFKKSHHVPDDANAFTQAFVARITEEEINADLERCFQRLRDEFGFKRRDMSIANPGEGGGTIVTPYFNYSVTVTLNPHDPTEVVWRRQVSEIKELSSIFSEPFDRVFERAFNTVELAPDSAVDVAALIDRLEDLDNPRIQLRYDKDATWCDVGLQGHAGEIRVEASSCRMVRARREPAGALLESFLSIYRALQEAHAETTSDSTDLRVL